MKRFFSTSYLIFIIIVIILFVACKRDSLPNRQHPPDNRSLYVGQYLPFYFGSKWYYTVKKVDKGKVLQQWNETWRYDSISNVIHIYAGKTLTSWIYCYRDDDHHFKAGGGQDFVTDLFLDSSEGKAYLTSQDTAKKRSRYTIGGKVLLQTKFGLIPCIQNYGINGDSSYYYFSRYFGKNIGIVFAEEYDFIAPGDTVDHYIQVLDSFSINK